MFLFYCYKELMLTVFRRQDSSIFKYHKGFLEFQCIILLMYSAPPLKRNMSLIILLRDHLNLLIGGQVIFSMQQRL